MKYDSRLMKTRRYKQMIKGLDAEFKRTRDSALIQKKYNAFVYAMQLALVAEQIDHLTVHMGRINQMERRITR